LISTQVVDKGANIDTYNPDPPSVKYEVDHKEEISTHWNKEGNNNDDENRKIALLKDSNLRIITEKHNKGKSGPEYDMWVLQEFTSRKAEDGKKGALTMEGLPLRNEKGEPLA
jgi:hypothetical protein